MQGTHLTADLAGCEAGQPAMTDPAVLRALCVAAVQAAGLQPVAELFHPFGPPGGVTGVVLLAESHLAVHTWPELGAVTLDAYVCNLGQDNSAKAEALVARLIADFAPQRVARQRWWRGGVASAAEAVPPSALAPDEPTVPFSRAAPPIRP